MIYNTIKKEYQFPSICETTEKGANTLLFKFIGNDARKWRFEIAKIEKDKALKIQQSLRDEAKIKRLHKELPNINYDVLKRLVLLNRGDMNEK